ncbi:hypothetical protein ZWY2020_052201 [Hordeum vulgare]|nr:hypothetical protein ZWY2020_052201 [Hordeum vulgare]
MSICQGRLPCEAELVPNPDDRVLELEILSKLTRCCAAAKGRLSLVLEVFPCDLQQQLDQFMSGRDVKVRMFVYKYGLLLLTKLSRGMVTPIGPNDGMNEAMN